MKNVQLPTGFTQRRVEQIGDVAYIGYSEVSELESSPKWLIKKLTGTDSLIILYASGSWEDRATLNYE